MLTNFIWIWIFLCYPKLVTKLRSGFSFEFGFKWKWKEKSGSESKRFRSAIWDNVHTVQYSMYVHQNRQCNTFSSVWCSAVERDFTVSEFFLLIFKCLLVSVHWLFTNGFLVNFMLAGGIFLSATATDCFS